MLHRYVLPSDALRYCIVWVLHTHVCGSNNSDNNNNNCMLQKTLELYTKYGPNEMLVICLDNFSKRAFSTFLPRQRFVLVFYKNNDCLNVQIS